MAKKTNQFNDFKKLISELKPYRKYQKMNLSGEREIYNKIINLPSSQSLILK